MYINKKNIAITLILIAMMHTITGCKNEIPEMTEQQNALITEYAAGLLLEYHADFDGRLVDTSIVPEDDPLMPNNQELNNQESDNPTEGDAESDIQQSVSVSESTIAGMEKVEKPELSLAQVLGTDGLDIVYRTYEVCMMYPETESSSDEVFFSMAAGPGNRLLVLKIDITNTSGQDVTCNTLAMTDLRCKIMINGNNTQNVYISMLENDFMSINRVLTQGETIETVVITEIAESEAEQITDVKLQIKNGDLSADVSAKQ